LSIDTTTGMSAPPIAITMWMPNNNAITVITASGSMPSGMDAAWTKRAPNQSTTTRPARFSQ